MSRYDKPPSNLRSLRDRLTQTAQREGLVFGRLQQHVAVLVVAQFASRSAGDTGPPMLLVKGGSSLELRCGVADSRTSRDLDVVARRDLAEVHERLAEAGERGWSGFTATFTAPEEIEVPGLPIKPRRFVAKLSYRGQPFASVPIEAAAVEAGNALSFDAISSEALSLIGIPGAGAIPCMTVPWQIAQKLHACTATLSPPKSNDRAHDLVDLQLLEALLGEVELHETRAACIAVFATRAQQSWPPAISVYPHWAAIYQRALEGLDHLDLAATVDEAADHVGD
ncbi:nucleotidyl transferase AbiEii/AbiGii toxin family protein [Sporichthya brevicatena]|uniref:Nucleotidyl transferase AbiEii/AbiGii toxin family protein n=1 Tax=Sporichthya brevicatena TaxID=171442 RepID=A0ABN1GP93_9ACTN